MPLTIKVTPAESIVTLNIAGDVDTKTAPELLKELTALELKELSELRLNLSEVSFMSSAGLRAIVFAKQKMPHTARLYLISASEMIVDTVKKTGLSQAVVFVSSEEEI
mgnify:CR=1 FL=1|jgi:anti-anti-sigma factor